ncbi:MAG: tetratricopeptide repeat protein, partial [Anaerolineae bacterium]|nr:tetratricopeptide repeat protein [Anaerolineae bacterium]
TTQEIQQTFIDLLQAQQELRLGNHMQAYTIAKRVLKRDPDNPNPQASYIAGWLALQYVPREPGESDRLDEALEYLEPIGKPDWPAAMAAYGLARRRKAKREPEATRLEELDKVLAVFKEALSGDNSHIIDLNLESFWGPVAGIYRDMADMDPEHQDYYLDKAIECYQKALGVTPRSSYPMGNLAGLYLQRGQIAEAQNAFQRTLEFASAELVVIPNDYFHLMDVAMAGLMTVRERGTTPAKRAALFEAALDTLDDALGMDATCNLLSVSLGAGWERLLKYCPDEWEDTIEHLKMAVERVNEKMAELGCFG